MIKFEKLTTREIAYIATFGAVWGGSEVTLGMILHNFNIPFAGLMLTFIGVTIALITVKLTNKKRALIYVAIIATILKMLSLTTVKLGPIVGIICSALIAQTVILIFNINLISFILAAGLMCCWPFVQLILGQLIIYTPKIFSVYENLLAHVGLKDLKLWMLIILILILHFIVGSIAGILSWNLSKILLKQVNSNANITET